MDRRFNRYFVVGVVNTLLDLGIFSLLALAFDVPSLVAHAMSTTLVMTFSFFVNQRWVFKSESSSLATGVPFVAVTLFSAFVVQSAIIWLTQAGAAAFAPGVPLDIVLPLAKTAAMGVGMFFNYFGYRLVFANRRP